MSPFDFRGDTDVPVHISETVVTESVEEKFLGVILDKNLDFTSHVNAICKKAGQKLHVLERVSSYLNVAKLRIMMNTFVMSQVSYCTLIWMFHDRSVNKKLNKIHERALRITYKDSCSSFDDLLKKAESVSIHQRKLKLFATEIFKTQSNLNPSFMKQIFVHRDVPYHLRCCRNTFVQGPKTTEYGIESACFLGSRIWHAMPSSIKESQTLNNIKRKIQSYDFDRSCTLSRLYIGNSGFL